MDSTTDNGRSSEDGEAGGKTEGGSDQIYFINASENCLTGTMPDEEEMPGLHNAVNLFMQEKSLEPQQISRHTSQDANVFEGRDEWWPIEENTKSLGQHQVLIDPPTQTEPPTALAADRLNKAEAEPSATETFECSAGNPATFLSDWDIDDRKRGNKAAQWAATTELQIAASKTQACKQAWQKDLLLRQFIREMQRKLQRMTNRAQERLVALTSHKNLPKDLSKELIRVILPPGVISKPSSCAHPFCQATKGKRLGASLSGTALGTYRLSLEPVANLELTQVPEMLIARDEKHSLAVRTPRGTQSHGTRNPDVQWFCLTCVEDLFCGKDLLGSVRAMDSSKQKATTVDATNARRASHRSSEWVPANRIVPTKTEHTTSVGENHPPATAARPIVIFWRRPKSPDDTARGDPNRGPLNSTSAPDAPKCRIRSLKLTLNPPNYAKGHLQTLPVPQRSTVRPKSKTAATENIVVTQLAPCADATTNTHCVRRSQRRVANKPALELGCCSEGEGKGALNVDGLANGEIQTSVDKGPNLEAPSDGEIETWFDRKALRNRQLSVHVDQSSKSNVLTQVENGIGSSNRSAQAEIWGIPDRSDSGITLPDATGAKVICSNDNSPKAGTRRRGRGRGRGRSQGGIDRQLRNGSVTHSPNRDPIHDECQTPSTNRGRRQGGRPSRKPANAFPKDIKTSPLKRNSCSPSTSQPPRDTSPPPAFFGPFSSSSTSSINGLTPFHQLSSFIYPETRQHPSGYLTLSFCQIAALGKWKSEIDRTLMLGHPENRKFMERNGLLYNYPEAPQAKQEEDEQEDSRAYFDDEALATEEEDSRAYFDDAEDAIEEGDDEEEELDIRNHGYPLHRAWIRPCEGPIRGVMEEGGKIIELSAKEVRGQTLSTVMGLVDEKVKEELRRMGKEWDR